MDEDRRRKERAPYNCNIEILQAPVPSHQPSMQNMINVSRLSDRENIIQPQILGYTPTMGSARVSHHGYSIHQYTVTTQGSLADVDGKSKLGARMRLGWSEVNQKLLWQASNVSTITGNTIISTLHINANRRGAKIPTTSAPDHAESRIMHHASTESRSNLLNEPARQMLRLYRFLHEGIPYATGYLRGGSKIHA
ncbi:hypothetical protein BD779DRAFT_1477031 [Infundibulicybe gibba]|nr:hypothetical protein BD779DRAFT_1477031 [Infundibulicybe gibba]